MKALAGAVCATIVLTVLLPGSWEPIFDDSRWLIVLLVLSGANRYLGSEGGDRVRDDVPITRLSTAR